MSLATQTLSDLCKSKSETLINNLILHWSGVKYHTVQSLYKMYELQGDLVHILLQTEGRKKSPFVSGLWQSEGCMQSPFVSRLCQSEGRIKSPFVSGL